MMRLMKLFGILAVLAGPLLYAAAGQAADDPVLTVTAGGVETTYTLEDLRAMPASSFETSTIWTEGVQEFTGVSLHDFLNMLDTEGSTLHATAINDYSVQIPMSDAAPGGPIIAYAQNGAEMPRRNKGPLWILYPYDSAPEFQTETYFSRSIWQLDRLAIE